MSPFIFLFVIAIYIIACVFIGRRIVQLFKSRIIKIIAIVFVVALSLMFFGQHILARAFDLSLGANRLLYLIGTMWLVIILYSMTLFLMFDIARLMSRIRTGERKPMQRGAITTIFLLVIIILSVGIHNAYTPVVTRYSAKVSQLTSKDTIRIAIASDLHMGYAVRKSDIEELRDMVNAENVDAFVIAGDLFDGDNKPVIEDNIGAPLTDIKTKYGTIAVVGNHDYMGDINTAQSYIKNLGIKLLKDSVIRLDKITFIGRNDLSSNRMMMIGLQRKPISEMAQRNDSTIMVVIDHQPGAIEESIEAGADIHISGHTHAGQVWPMRVLTRLAFKQDYGYRQYDHTHAIVSSGFGTWGPRVRLGNNAEIVVLTITGF